MSFVKETCDQGHTYYWEGSTFDYGCDTCRADAFRREEARRANEEKFHEEVRKFIELWDGWEHGMGRFEPHPPKRVRLQLEKLREFVPASYAIAHEADSSEGCLD